MKKQIKKPTQKGVVSQTINNALSVNQQNERLYKLLEERTEELAESKKTLEERTKKMIEVEEKLQIAKDEIYCYKVILAVASCFFFTVLAVFIFNQMK